LNGVQPYGYIYKNVREWFANAMISFKLIIGTLFGLLVAAVSVLGVISYKNSQLLQRTSIRVQNTGKAIHGVEKIYSLSKDLQLESNAVFIINDTSVLKYYENAKYAMASNLNTVRSLVHEGQRQQERMDTLELYLQQLIVFSDSFLTRGEVARERPPQKLEAKLVGNKHFRQKIRSIVNAIKNEEERLLLTDQRENQQSTAAFERTFILLLVAIAILLATTFFSVRYNFNKRMRMQQELKTANELFEKLFYESPIGLVMTRQSDGVVIDCNEAYSKLVEYPREELMGASAVGLNILNGEPHRLKEMPSNGTVKEVETWLKPKHSEPIWASVSVQVIEVENQPCLLNAISDLTAHKHAEDEIRKALEAQTELNKMKADFVTMASHEFRTPLTTIQSSSFILAKYDADEFKDKVGRQLTRIKTAIHSITSMLDEFLSLSKIEEGEIELQPNVLNVKEYLSNACLNLKTFAKPGQEIIYHHDGKDFVFIDKSMLGNIVENLITNAIKYSPENSAIHVSCHVNKRIHLSVKDSGIGIPVEDQKHLFERFYRATNAGNVQGTGLGLHILKRYVELAKGDIEVNSEVGKGTEFKITLAES
jgi:PAS domain S-box-containing protein